MVQIREKLGVARMLAYNRDRASHWSGALAAFASRLNDPSLSSVQPEGSLVSCNGDALRLDGQSVDDAPCAYWGAS